MDDRRCLHLGPVLTTGASCALHVPLMRAKHAMLDELSATMLSDLTPVS